MYVHEHVHVCAWACTCMLFCFSLCASGMCHKKYMYSKAMPNWCVGQWILLLTRPLCVRLLCLKNFAQLFSVWQWFVAWLLLCETTVRLLSRWHWVVFMCMVSTLYVRWFLHCIWLIFCLHLWHGPLMGKESVTMNLSWIYYGHFWSLFSPLRHHSNFASFARA